MMALHDHLGTLADHLGPRDICRLRQASASLRQHLDEAPEIWAGVACRLGLSRAVLSFDSMREAYLEEVLELDDLTAFSAQLSRCRTRATLCLGGLPAPWNHVAAVNTVVRFTGRSRPLATPSLSWSVSLLRLPPLKGVILWVGVAYPKYGKQLDLTRETMKGLLSPFSFKARSPGEGSPKKPALITRFIDSDWEAPHRTVKPARRHRSM